MPSDLLRDADTEKSDRVGFIELFFDLIFVFAATQLSHRLIERGSLDGLLESLVLFLALWSVWTSTTWITNWLDVERNTVRLLLLALMIGGTFQSLAIPDAFSANLDARAFALVHVAMQVGRASFAALVTRGQHAALNGHLVRAAIWKGFAAPLWIAGAWSPGDERLAFWAAALCVEFGAPAVGYWLPGVGTSATTEQHVKPAHYAERCGLFVIIAIGEQILLTGSTVGELTRDLGTTWALLLVLLAAMAFWWIYFSYSAEKATETVDRTSNPGRVTRIVYVYLHVPILVGLLVTAASNEPFVEHPWQVSKPSEIWLTLGGPALFLAGVLGMKRYVCERWISSHVAGLLGLGALAPIAGSISILALNVLATGILIAVAVWEELAIRADKRRTGHENEGAEESFAVAEAT